METAIENQKTQYDYDPDWIPDREEALDELAERYAIMSDADIIRGALARGDFDQQFLTI